MEKEGILGQAAPLLWCMCVCVPLYLFLSDILFVLLMLSTWTRKKVWKTGLLE